MDFGILALWITVIFNAVGALLLLLYLISNKKLTYNDTLYRVALGVSAIGLLGQFIRSFVGITTGVAPTDVEMPFWVFKDIGLLMLIIHIFLVVVGKIKADVDDQHLVEHLEVTAAYADYEAETDPKLKKEKKKVFENKLFSHIKNTHKLN